jgi:hypothetical protein
MSRSAMIAAVIPSPRCVKYLKKMSETRELRAFIQSAISILSWKSSKTEHNPTIVKKGAVNALVCLRSAVMAVIIKQQK